MPEVPEVGEMKCPICLAELTTTESHNDHIIMESETVCSNCQRYKEYFNTGCYEIGIKLAVGWRAWQWDHDTPKAQHDKINMEVFRMATVARREYFIEHAIGRFAS
jgi:hypothetical protein